MMQFVVNNTMQYKNHFFFPVAYNKKKDYNALVTFLKAQLRLKKQKKSLEVLKEIHPDCSHISTFPEHRLS